MKNYIFAFFCLIFSFSVHATFCVAHRGDNAFHLENSMAAIKSALVKGSDYIEFDVRHTRDGEPFILHDKRLSRVVDHSLGHCPVNEKVHRLQWDSIRNNCRLNNGEKIPHLEDVLSEISKTDSGIFLEYKDAPKFKDLLLVQQYFLGKSDRVYFISFKEKYLRTIKEWVSESLPNLSAAKYLPLKVKMKKKKLRDHFDGVSIKYIKKKKIKFIQEKKKIVSIWTKTSKRLIKKYIKRKVDFITTDNPKRCLKLVKR